MNRSLKILIGTIAVTAAALVAATTNLQAAPDGRLSKVVQGQAERHPHIRTAIRELREAARELKEADHDFGGHREAALKATDAAIEQLRKALEFDKK